MTNTLHRFGPAESFRDDYVVFAIASKGRNDEGALEKLRRFLEIAVRFKPVNLGDAIHGGALRPSTHMTPESHWHRDATPDFDAVIRGLDAPTTVAAVFDKVEQDSGLGIVDAAVALARSSGADVIVSLGGGSCIDTAKTAAVGLANGWSAIESIGIGVHPKGIREGTRSLYDETVPHLSPVSSLSSATRGRLRRRRRLRSA